MWKSYALLTVTNSNPKFDQFQTLQSIDHLNDYEMCFSQNSYFESISFIPLCQCKDEV